MDKHFRDDNWRKVLSAAALTGDPTVAAMSTIAGVPPETAVRVADDAVQAGLLEPAGVNPELAGELLDGLSPDRYAELHAAAARFYALGGPDDLIRAITMARRAAGVIPHEELVAIVDTAAAAQLLSGNDAAASELYREADGLDPNRTSLQRSERLTKWARAEGNGGNTEQADSLRMRAFDIAESNRDGRLMADIIVDHCTPPDWRSGSEAVNRLLTRADRVAADGGDQARLLAVRAMQSMRIPIDPGTDNQTGWITQPKVAQPMAEKALRMAADTNDEAELVALLAWRHTHRSPAHLARRIETSLEAIELAQSIPAPGHLAQVCLWAAADAIESGNATDYDRVVTLARWASDRSGSPRTSWLALTLLAGRAFMESRITEALMFKDEALKVGRDCGEAGALSADLFFLGQSAVEQWDLTTLASLVLPGDSDLLQSPSIRMAHSLILALQGRHDEARRDLEIGLRQLDDESSLLWMLGIATRTACLIGDETVMRRLVDLLAPWSHHVAVDSNAWWCLGPVTLLMAELNFALGDIEATRPLVAEGAYTAERLGDLRSLQRAQMLLAAVGPLEATPPSGSGRLDVLTDRERHVLEQLASGSTNQQIAAELAYSHATVRRDTISIYRKLGVNGRVEATALAIAEGLVGQSNTPAP